MAVHLPLSHYDLQKVLLPGKNQKPVEAIRITVYGDNFPMRALEPEIFVGEEQAQGVEVAADQRSIRGYLLKAPRKGGLIRVRYGPSQEGLLRDEFDPERIRPLPQDCS